ncbi:transglycosylase SLT domain-containing protein [Motiliproteus sp.]|uniref:transglycosylase SLT domain-containing protein n=1 Tax=Motiliproteus sp. TaxID=1898955 RepID=UPI003BA8C1E5
MQIDRVFRRRHTAPARPFSRFFTPAVYLLGLTVLSLPLPGWVPLSQASIIEQDRSRLEQQRQQYRQSKQALTKRDYKTYDRLITKLSDYPLYPYLLFQRHRQQLDTLNAEQLQQFEQRFSDTPLARRLYQSWISEQAKRKRWQQLIDNYRPESAGISLQCQYLWALHQQGQTDKMLPDVGSIWVHGSSRPKACDKPFELWLKSDQYTEQHAWDRFWLALEKGNTKLAGYIRKRLNKPEWKSQAKQALSWHRKPQQLSAFKLNSDQVLSPDQQRLMMITLKRLGRQEPLEGLDQLVRLAEPLGLTPETQQQLHRSFAVRQLRRYPDSIGELSQRLDPNNPDPQILEWQLRNLILRQDWKAVTKLLDQLPESERERDRWRYWQARALEAQGDTEQTEKAAQIYNKLAFERSFYGFMAADKLGGGYQLNNRTLAQDPDYIGQLARQPGLIRARELYLHNQLRDARREWYASTRKLSREQRYQAAQLARQWGWYEQSIRGAIAARQWDDILLRFPVAYSDPIHQAANKHAIAPTWILAVARQESAFTPDARSHAGAMGLMQLMPATAKETAKKAKIRYRSRNQLAEPDFNIKLGSHYLAGLGRRYEGHRVLATAAYNAGPHRVKRWLAQRNDLPTDIWIETIPFDETRNYVQNVLSFSLIYSDILGQPKQLLQPHERMAVVPDPKARKASR